MLSLLMAGAVVTNIDVDSNNVHKFISQGIHYAMVAANEKKAQQNDSILTDLEKEVDESPDYTMKPQAFKLYLDKEVEAGKPIEPQEVYIDTEYDMGVLVQRIYQELPQEVVIKSNYFTSKQLKSMYAASESRLVADVNPNTKGLASYSVKQMGKNLKVSDVSNEDYSAYVIKKASDLFIKDLMQTLKGKTEIETINNVYDWMFHNFKYTANNYKSMLLGNMYTGEMACNGFSYLADALLEEAGIKTTIRSGYSHFWNVVTLENGQEATFDVTTDIVLGKYKATLGTSTKEHISITSPIGFYSAEFTNGYYHHVYSYEPLQLKEGGK